MRVGTLCYATDQGLGVLAKSFYENGIITDALVLQHSSRNTHWEWYPKSVGNNSNYRTHVDRIDVGKAKSLIREVDIMLFFETPFVWDLISYCKRINRPCVIMPMYECMPSELPDIPTAFFCPSHLDYEYYSKYPNASYIPVPVDVPWELRTTATRFVHNAGHGGLRGRNGTKELLEAMNLVKSDVKLTIRTQSPVAIPRECKHLINNKLEFEYGTVPHADLYTGYDVFVFPEKFNGLSLPLQEAHASGLAVMCCKRYPMNMWLPKDPMIPVHHYNLSQVSGRCNLFKEAVVRPEDIAATMDAWYGKRIESLSLDGKQYAQANSWEVLKPQYIKSLESLL